jgi:dsDNA-specific endonuclease/ATPase MutS2
LSIRIKEGDRVFVATEGEPGTVVTVYPEIHTAIVKTDIGTMKVKLDDLSIIPDTAAEPEEIKKATLLDKVKGRFSR